MLISKEGASWTLWNKWFLYLLIEITHLNQITFSQYLSKSCHIAAEVEQEGPGKWVNNGCEKTLECKALWLVLADGCYPEGGPSVGAHTFWSRISVKLQKIASMWEATGSMNKCLNSHLWASKQITTNHEFSTVVPNFCWSLEST